MGIGPFGNYQEIGDVFKEIHREKKPARLQKLLNLDKLLLQSEITQLYSWIEYLFHHQREEFKRYLESARDLLKNIADDENSFSPELRLKAGKANAEIRSNLSPETLENYKKAGRAIFEFYNYLKEIDHQELLIKIPRDLIFGVLDAGEKILLERKNILPGDVLPYLTLISDWMIFETVLKGRVPLEEIWPEARSRGWLNQKNLEIGNKIGLWPMLEPLLGIQDGVFKWKGREVKERERLKNLVKAFIRITEALQPWNEPEFDIWQKDEAYFLDLGSGIGAYLPFLAKLYPSTHFVGIEIDNQRAIWAQDWLSLFPDVSKRIKIIQGDVTKLEELFENVSELRGWKDKPKKIFNLHYPVIRVYLEREEYSLLQNLFSDIAQSMPGENWFSTDISRDLGQSSDTYKLWEGIFNSLGAFKKTLHEYVPGDPWAQPVFAFLFNLFNHNFNGNNMQVYLKTSQREALEKISNLFENMNGIKKDSEIGSVASQFLESSLERDFVRILYYDWSFRFPDGETIFEKVKKILLKYDVIHQSSSVNWERVAREIRELLRILGGG
ncbi:MAG: class I SAM-dependent methyltransferase [Candidatus Omnitrophica bacterium]|nr:class I SAM-dependent methyltransferase [Candidatus Omnitrophota bacterium]